MPNYVIKTAKNRDCYVIWSENVGSPTFIGTRADAGRRLKAWGEWGDGSKLDRADRYGSSARQGADYGWDDKGWAVSDTDLPAGAGDRWLPRENLEAFARALDTGHKDVALALTRPVEER